MYCWQFGCNGVVIMGRTWAEFQELMHAISDFLRLDDRRKIIVYVHNLAYEFQFMRRWFEWRDVFAVKPRTPISAEIVGAGIIFRCSLALSGMKLDTLAKSLRYFHDVRKQMGSLNYRVMRNSHTLLSEQEITYCIFDAVIVMCYIAQCADDEGGDIGKIPRTKTGYVRRRCRDDALYHKNEPDEKRRKQLFFQYRRLMQDLTLQPDEYLMMRRAFCGGFTHAQLYDVDFIIYGVRSMDFTSSYPAVCVMDYFPMSRGRRETVTDAAHFDRLCGMYCVIADVRFINLRPRIDYEFYLSKSKCRDFEYEIDENGRGQARVLCDNGRVVSAAALTTTITEIDFDIMKRVYTWDSIEIGDCWTYQRGRLPSSFVSVIAELYEMKTALKGVSGKEKEYALAKADLNSLYGMMVTDILRDILEYTDEWQDAQKPDIVNVIDDYNKSGSRCTFYAWGVYVTAHARRRLWSGILECGTDYKYSDTDSIKLTHFVRHAKYFDNYNKRVIDDLRAAAAYHKIPLSKFIPKTVDGVEKPLGVWDYDGDYQDFKTLGAKRYMYHDKSGALHCTISGVNPAAGAVYFDFAYGGDLRKFSDDLVFPAEYNRDDEIVSGTGKLCHTYDDSECSGILTDYQGRTAEYHEKSFVHLAPTEYSLSIASEFAYFLTGGEIEIGI